MSISFEHTTLQTDGTEEGEDKPLSWAGVTSQYTPGGDTGSPAHGNAAPESPQPTQDGHARESTEHARLRQLASEHNHVSHSEQDEGFRLTERHHYFRKHRPCEVFLPDYLPELPSDSFCMPIFFPSEESYQTFHSVLQSANETLDVCVFSMTDNATASVLIHAKERGVEVRIITDNDQLDGKGADVKRLHEDYNIPFKTDTSDQFMHNKFAVIDRKIVLTGSFNWSIGARFKNKENVLITNIATVVDSFHHEFEKLWDQL